MNTNPPTASHTSSDLDAALALASENVCESLLDFDWASWKQQLKGDSASLKDLITVLARLSREVLAREKYREELAAQQTDKVKRAPTLAEIALTEEKLKL